MAAESICVVTNSLFDIEPAMKQLVLMYDKMLICHIGDEHTYVDYLRQHGVAQKVPEYNIGFRDAVRNNLLDDEDLSSRIQYAFPKAKLILEEVYGCFDFSVFPLKEGASADELYKAKILLFGSDDIFSSLIAELYNSIFIGSKIFTPALSGACFYPDFEKAMHDIEEIMWFYRPFLDTDIHTAMAKQSNITRVILSKLPVPTEDTSWEDILEFKEDGKTKDQIRRLKRWMGKVNEIHLTKNN